MANQEHLDILRQGVEVWNQWRKEHSDVKPDFTEVDFREANLTETNFQEADLSSANLAYAILNGADFSRATLNGATLSRAMLCGAILNGADLSEANLTAAMLWQADLSSANLTAAKLNGADLSVADLSEANLYLTALFVANLNHTKLSRTDFSQALMKSTAFGDVDLSVAKGLDTVIHLGPSTIGIDTIYNSKGHIPEVFLKGAGVDDTFITYIRSLVGKAIEYYSCFISYSSYDETFAKRLYADLQNQNVRCWFAPEDLKWGEGIHTGIDEAIHLHDKLLLILSKYSVASGWVEHEVKAALKKERKEKRTVLYPVRVDGAVFESPFAWTTEIRHERNIGDFTRWKKDHDAYQKAFTRLLHDLKVEA